MRRLPRYEIYRDTAGLWRWRLVAANNRIIAVSGEGYTRKSDAQRAYVTVRVTLSRYVRPS